MNKIIGLVLIAAGVLALVYGGITYTTREKVLDLGPLQATADREKKIQVPPALGAGVIGAGVVLLLIPGRRKKS
ncbi:MAG: hypothetical protein ACYC8T_11070 [Myxococcaceae bacterium]